MKKLEDKKPSITKGEVDQIILLGCLLKIEDLEIRLNSSNLHSPIFWKRSLAVVGHYYAFMGVVFGGLMFIGLLLSAIE
jgi:hypothetical protein